MIRLWKLGNSNRNRPIFPNEEAVNRLIDLLKQDEKGKVMDIVWDDMLSITVITDDGQVNG